MHTTHYPSDLSWNYGLGWIIKNKIFRADEIGHSGGWPGVHTLATIHPEKDLAVIVFERVV